VNVLRSTAAAAIVLAASGCTVSGSMGSTPRVSTGTLESTIAERLEAQVGQRPDSVSCPDELKGKTGETVRCSLTSGPSSYGITVKVTSVKDERVRFDIQVDDSPQ
jgi:hypothetical protein